MERRKLLNTGTVGEMSETEKEAALQLLDEALRRTLPEDCTARNLIGASLIADKCLDAFLKEKGYTRNCVAALALFMAIVADEGWRIPQHIHDRMCGCQRLISRAPTPQKRMWDLIAEWQLPTAESPESKGGVTYYAEVGGSRTYPLIVVWFYKGKSRLKARASGSASWHPRKKVWHNCIFSKGGNQYLLRTTNRDEAIRTVLEAVQQK